ncbi:MAG: helix-turn-helix domain-containing protein [Proteobacteria bacterium]|nr:helix-turn-helix domain-containing protein [Pseudomonadota bacterium]
MTSCELRAILRKVGISQSDLAQLIGITARAVSLWMTDDTKPVPGAVSAYANLLASLPENSRENELRRLKKGRMAMRDGMYGIGFRFGDAGGEGILTFEDGRVYGVDAGGARYDGTYVYNEVTGLTDVFVKVTFPPNGYSVFGIVHPYEWSIDVVASLNPKLDAGETMVKTSIGKELPARYRFLRDLPLAA